MSNFLQTSNTHLSAIKAKINTLATDIDSNQQALHSHNGASSAEKLTSLLTKADSIISNTANIKASIEVGGDLFVSQDEVEAKLDSILAKNTEILTENQAIHDRQDDILTSNNATKLSAATIATKITSLEGSNHTDLTAINSRQDDVLTAVNATKLTNDTIATKTSALLTANHTDLGNIFSRQDDILTAVNATKLTNDTIATKTSALLTANHTDLEAINSRQDDVLTAVNATKLTNDTIATKTSALLTANHTDLNNIFNRQDDILTSTNAVKTNTQSLENCIGSNKVNVNVSSNATDFATESTLQIISEFNCDTTDTTITSCALPSGASTAALQGTANTALAEIEGAVETLEGCVGSNKVNVNISSGGFDGAITNAALTELGTAINSDRVDVNIANGGFNGAITNAALTELGGAINSDRVDVNIANGGFNGAITNAALTELAAAINSDRVDVNIANGGFDGAITNTGLTNLNNCIGSNKVNVNISSGNITGFSTSANQSTANGHLLALANVVNPAIATATATTIPNKLDTLETSQQEIVVELTAAQTKEDKEVIDNDSISANSLSIAIDTENYEKIRLYGNTTAAVASNFTLFGSSASNGTYYHLPNSDFQANSLTISGSSEIHYIGATIENPPRYVKVYNKNGSSAYTITKLRLVGSNKYIN